MVTAFYVDPQGYSGIEEMKHLNKVETMKRSENEPLLLRGPEVAELLGCSRALAYRWMQNGVLPTVRVPGARSVRVPKAALVAWIAARTTPPVATRPEAVQ